MKKHDSISDRYTSIETMNDLKLVNETATQLYANHNAALSDVFSAYEDWLEAIDDNESETSLKTRYNDFCWKLDLSFKRTQQLKVHLQGMFSTMSLFRFYAQTYNNGKMRTVKGRSK